MAKISQKTYKEIRRIILAGQLFPLAEISLKSLLEKGNAGLYQNIVLKEVQKFIFNNPEYKNYFNVGNNDAYLQINLLQRVKDIFLRYINENIYQMGVSALNLMNKIPNGFNNEIIMLRKRKTCDIKAELSSILKYQPEIGSTEEKAISIVKCIFESLIYSRSLLGRIEGFFIRYFSNINIQNIEKEIFACI